MAVTTTEYETAKEILGGFCDPDEPYEFDEVHGAVSTVLLGLEEAMDHNASLSRQLDGMALFTANVCREVDYFRGGR